MDKKFWSTENMNKRPSAVHMPKKLTKSMGTNNFNRQLVTQCLKTNVFSPFFSNHSTEINAPHVCVWGGGACVGFCAARSFKWQMTLINSTNGFTLTIVTILSNVSWFTASPTLSSHVVTTNSIPAMAASKFTFRSIWWTRALCIEEKEDPYMFIYIK